MSSIILGEWQWCLFGCIIDYINQLFVSWPSALKTFTCVYRHTNSICIVGASKLKWFVEIQSRKATNIFMAKWRISLLAVQQPDLNPNNRTFQEINIEWIWLEDKPDRASSGKIPSIWWWTACGLQTFQSLIYFNCYLFRGVSLRALNTHFFCRSISHTHTVSHIYNTYFHH